MSLDVYLSPVRLVKSAEGSGVFVRDQDKIIEISRKDWDEKFPGLEPVEHVYDCEGYAANITHNLGKMAAAAGIYTELWRPEEIGITKARQLIEPLRAGLTLLLAEPARFEMLNPDNGWGTYDGLVKFVSAYLAACGDYPDADVTVSR